MYLPRASFQSGAEVWSVLLRTTYVRGAPSVLPVASDGTPQGGNRAITGAWDAVGHQAIAAGVGTIAFGPRPLGRLLARQRRLAQAPGRLTRYQCR
jgi:hypothetical protein